MDSPPPAWKLEVFDRDGAIIASALKTPDGPPTMFGSADDLAHAVAEAKGLHQFFTDPEAIGRAAYMAWREMIIGMQAQHGASHITSPRTWEQLKASEEPVHKESITRWIAIGQAAIACPPTCN